MALSKVTINKGASGLGRRLLSSDGISGLLFYNGTLPAGFSASDRVKKVFSIEEAEALGIAKDSVNSAVEWYHINEFFRINPSGSLWIGIFAIPGGAYDFAEVETMQNIATGEIRLFGVYNANDEAFAGAAVTALQAKLTVLDGLNTPAVALYAPDFAAVADLSTLADLRALSAPDVSVILGQDDAGDGAALYVSKGYSITAVGAILGALSSAKVSQSPANVENFNLSGSQLTIPGFANGQAFRDITKTASGALKDKGYTILRDYLPGNSGTYVERIPQAVPATSDYAFNENRRVVHKAHRDLVAVYQPKLNSTILLDKSGKLSASAVETFKGLGKTVVIDGMIANGDISDGLIVIDPDQDILSTSNLVITAKILPLGIAEFITVNINLVPQI
jgi:hypothetical protein